MEICDTIKLFRLKNEVVKYAPAGFSNDFEKLIETAYFDNYLFFSSALDNSAFFVRYDNNSDFINGVMEQLKTKATFKSYSLPGINFKLVVLLPKVPLKNFNSYIVFFFPNERLSKLLQMEA